MLNTTTNQALPGMAITSSILILAIVTGALFGHFVPVTGEWLGNRVDYTLLALVGVLFLVFALTLFF